MHEEQKDIDIDSVRKNYKEFIKNKKVNTKISTNIQRGKPLYRF